jgi:hypothetical protein
VTATLTEAELAEVRERHARDEADRGDPRGMLVDAGDDAIEDRAALLAHIDALTAELASVRAERLLLARGYRGTSGPMHDGSAYREVCALAARIVATAEREEVERG